MVPGFRVEASVSSRPRAVLARLLLDTGLADMTLLGMATRIATEGDVSLVHALLRWRFVAAADLARALAETLGLPVTPLVSFEGPVPLPVSRTLCARLRVLPLWRRGDVVGLAMSDPTDDSAVHEITRVAGGTIERLLVDDDELDLALRAVFGRTATPTAMGQAASGSSWGSQAPSAPVVPAAPVQPPLPPVLPPAPAPSTPPAPSMFAAPPTALAAAPPTTERTPPQERTPTPSQLPPVDSTARIPRAPTPPTVEVKPAPAPSDRSELFVDPVSEMISVVDDDAFLSQSSGVFSNNTVDLPMPRIDAPLPVTRVTVPLMLPPPPVAEPTRAPAPAVSEVTNEIHAMEFSDPTALVAALPPAAPAVVSDDKTIPNDNVLFVMRVLLVGEGAAVDTVGGELRRRIRQFQQSPLAVAGRELEQRRYDAVIVVDPPDTVTGAQQLAIVASRARSGVVVISNTPDHARLPGVRTVQTRPPDGELAELVLDLLQRRARGE